MVEQTVKMWVDYTDVAGLPQQLILSGDAAVLVQHKVDYLDGIFARDNVADTAIAVSVESIHAANSARLARVRNMIGGLMLSYAWPHSLL